MLSLYRKFPFDAVSINQPRKTCFAGYEIHSNERRELICKTSNNSFVVADDVYAYYIDDNALWYSKREDLTRGRDFVYRVNMKNIRDRRRGIIDDDRYFLYSENGYLYCENNTGDFFKLCAMESVEQLSLLSGQRKGLSIQQLEKALGAEKGRRSYTETQFYKDLSELHSLVASLEGERKADTQTSTASARIIAKVIQMCCEMNKNVSKPLEKIIEKEIV